MKRNIHTAARENGHPTTIDSPNRTVTSASAPNPGGLFDRFISAVRSNPLPSAAGGVILLALLSASGPNPDADQFVDYNNFMSECLMQHEGDMGECNRQWSTRSSGK